MTSFLEYLAGWVETQRPFLAGFGKVKYSATADELHKPSAYLVVERDDGYFTELILWSSGESEFGYGRPGNAVDRHYDLADVEDLESLLIEFVGAVAAPSR